MVECSLQNVGYAPIYREPEVWIALRDKAGEEIRYYKAKEDIRALAGGNEAEQLASVTAVISLAGEIPGEYEVYLDIRDAATQERIFLGNEQEAEQHGYKIGTLRMDSI